MVPGGYIMVPGGYVNKSVLLICSGQLKKERLNELYLYKSTKMHWEDDNVFSTSLVGIILDIL